MVADVGDLVPHSDSFPAGLVRAFVETAQHLYASEDLDETALRLTTSATQAIHGCDFASLTVMEGTGLVTRGATNPIADKGDAIQYETDEGPCVEAARKATVTYTPNMADDSRWPKFSSRVGKELGVGSLLSCRLVLDASPQRTLGALNLYSTEVNAYGDEDRIMALLFAAVAGIVLDAGRRQQQLREAMGSREVIGQAMGILMAQSGVTAEQAFDQLRSASQRLNIKLRDLAARIAASTHGPHPIPPPDERAQPSTE
jgi:hypothetical protein